MRKEYILSGLVLLWALSYIFVLARMKVKVPLSSWRHMGFVGFIVGLVMGMTVAVIASSHFSELSAGAFAISIGFLGAYVELFVRAKKRSGAAKE